MKRSATPFPFRLTHEGGRAFNAQEGDLLLEVVRHVVRTVVVSELQPHGHVLSDGTEVLANPLADRLQGLEPIGAPVGMDTNAFRVAMIHGDEDVGQPLAQGHRLGHIGSPHHVHGLGSDFSVVDTARTLGQAVRRR